MLKIDSLSHRYHFWNRNGRLQTWTWGQRQEMYTYDSRGLLTEMRSPDGSAGSRTISYGPYNLVFNLYNPIFIRLN